MKGVHRIQPSWGCASGYFYLPDTEYFAVGFVVDHKPSGGELLQYALPLYVQKFECHLSFAVRLSHSDGEFNAKGKSPDEMGREFTSKAEPYLEQVRQRDSLPVFASFVESLDALRNDRVRYVYALTMIMLERPREAIAHLRVVAGSDWAKRVVPDEARAAAELADDIESGSGAALARLIEWADHNRGELALSPVT
ncbi:MAG: hypothetical protein QNJ14_10505 [Woeseiaceae bacterium]|nr:hypothetical protein [Woeseiaceae bacterium]